MSSPEIWLKVKNDFMLLIIQIVIFFLSLEISFPLAILLIYTLNHQPNHER